MVTFRSTFVANPVKFSPLSYTKNRNSSMSIVPDLSTSITLNISFSS